MNGNARTILRSDCDTLFLENLQCSARKCEFGSFFGRCLRNFSAFFSKSHSICNRDFLACKNLFEKFQFRRRTATILPSLCCAASTNPMDLLFRTPCDVTIRPSFGLKAIFQTGSKRSSFWHSQWEDHSVAMESGPFEADF